VVALVGLQVILEPLGGLFGSLFVLSAWIVRPYCFCGCCVFFNFDRQFLGTFLVAGLGGAVVVDSTILIRTEWYFTIIIRRYAFFKDKYTLYYAPGSFLLLLKCLV
jgi:hypothetical protein